MNRDKRDFVYPVDLESQFIMRLPEEPAKALRKLLKTEENLKKRLTIELENDMRHAEVRFDHWLLHAKVVDLPTIIESLKTIDRKSAYKTADICQLMICKYEVEPRLTEEESLNKTKGKVPLKVDKKFLWPHGITPPTKNVRKRRFRKTLRKKCAEAHEIEKQVKTLLRADSEAFSVEWEMIELENDSKSEAKSKHYMKNEIENLDNKNLKKAEFDVLNESSKVEDIFGEAVSDSDLDDDNLDVDVEDSTTFCPNDDHLSNPNLIQEIKNLNSNNFATQFGILNSPHEIQHNMPESDMLTKQNNSSIVFKTSDQHKEKSNLHQESYNKNDPMAKLQQLRNEIEELTHRKQRTQFEISELENFTLRQRFQDILQTLNQDIMLKQMEYQNLHSLIKAKKYDV